MTEVNIIEQICNLWPHFSLTSFVVEENQFSALFDSKRSLD